MTYDRPPGQVPATPEYILAEIRDSHRQQCQFDPEADPSADLTFETTIAEWRDACDLIEWKDLGRAIDSIWNLGRTDEAWRSVLEPAGQHTLRDLCEFIAQGATRPTIEPLKILGSECLPAGAFLAIRSLLRDAGVDTDPIAPSTPLGEYARRYLGVFLGPISRLAPGSLPAVKVRTPLYDLSCMGLLCGLLIGFLSCPIALAINLFFAAESVAVTVAVSMALTGLALLLVSGVGMEISGRRWPKSAEFGDLRTFGDLARAIAAGHQADAQAPKLLF